MRDYSLAMYRELCQCIRRSGRESLLVRDLVVRDDLAVDARCIVLRHDIDRGARHAAATGEVEHEAGLRASYYFRTDGSAWDEGVIRGLAEMGHEIGLHYECLDKARGDVARAAEILRGDLARLRAICPVDTVAMHGNPTTPWDNRDLWADLDFADFGLRGETYLSVDFSKVLYYNESSRTWADSAFTVKDVIPDGQARIANEPPARTTRELMALVDAEPRNLYLLTHPNRWPASAAGWLYSWATDQAINYAKLAFKTWRRLRRRASPDAVQHRAHRP